MTVILFKGISSPIKRSTLAVANECRDWRICAEFSQWLIAHDRKLDAEEDSGLDLSNTVFAPDSTTIDRCLSLFPRAPFRSTKAAVKMHTQLDLRDNISSFIHSEICYLAKACVSEEHPAGTLAVNGWEYTGEKNWRTVVNDDFLIKSEEELDAIFGEPHELVKGKSRSSLDASMKEFVRRSPLICMSTIDKSGQVDVSPKGDAPGFVHIDDDGNMLIPDRPGNRLVLGFRNLLENSSIGVIFIVPTMKETLRVKGQATITNDPSILEKLSTQEKPALLCTHIKIEECFFHCGKAMIRSHMWKPEKWIEHTDSLMVLHVAKRFNADAETEKAIESEVERAYRDELY